MKSIALAVSLLFAASASAQQTFKLGVVSFLSGPAAESFGVPAVNVVSNGILSLNNATTQSNSSEGNGNIPNIPAGNLANRISPTAALTLNSGVLSDAQRAAATDPVVRNLINLIPPANATQVIGGVTQPRFIGSGTAPVNIDQFTGDVTHSLGKI